MPANDFAPINNSVQSTTDIGHHGATKSSSDVSSNGSNSSRNSRHSAQFSSTSQSSSSSFRSLTSKFTGSFHKDYHNLCRSKDRKPVNFFKLNPSSCKTRLNLCADKISFRDWELIFSALRVDSTLQSVSVQNRRVGILKLGHFDDIDTREKAQKFDRVPVILTCFLMRKLAYTLTACLNRTNSLTNLHLEALPLKTDYINILCKGLEKCTSLSRLALPYCLIGDDACVVLCRALKHLPNITILDLTSCGLSQIGVDSVVSVIKFQQLYRYSECWEKCLRYRAIDTDAAVSGLRRVTLNQNQLIGDEGAIKIIDALIDDNFIRAVDLQNCRLTERILPDLSKLIETNRRLVVFDVRLNRIGERAISLIKNRLPVVSVPVGVGSQWEWKSLETQLNDVWKSNSAVAIRKNPRIAKSSSDLTRRNPSSTGESGGGGSVSDDCDERLTSGSGLIRDFATRFGNSLNKPCTCKECPSNFEVSSVSVEHLLSVKTPESGADVASPEGESPCRLVICHPQIESPACRCHPSHTVVEKRGIVKSVSFLSRGNEPELNRNVDESGNGEGDGKPNKISLRTEENLSKFSFPVHDTSSSNVNQMNLERIEEMVHATAERLNFGGGMNNQRLNEIKIRSVSPEHLINPCCSNSSTFSNLNINRLICDEPDRGLINSDRSPYNSLTRKNSTEETGLISRDLKYKFVFNDVNEAREACKPVDANCNNSNHNNLMNGGQDCKADDTSICSKKSTNSACKSLMNDNLMNNSTVEGKCTDEKYNNITSHSSLKNPGSSVNSVTADDSSTAYNGSVEGILRAVFRDRKKFKKSSIDASSDSNFGSLDSASSSLTSSKSSNSSKSIDSSKTHRTGSTITNPSRARLIELLLKRQPSMNIGETTIQSSTCQEFQPQYPEDMPKAIS